MGDPNIVFSIKVVGQRKGEGSRTFGRSSESGILAYRLGSPSLVSSLTASIGISMFECCSSTCVDALQGGCCLP